MGGLCRPDHHFRSIGARSNRQPESLFSAKPAAYYWREEFPYAGDYLPVQVARADNEVDLRTRINDSWRDRLVAVNPDTAWQYYRMNAVQWLTAEGYARPQNEDGVSLARNSVLETYLIGDQTLAAQVPAVANHNRSYPTEVGSSNLQSTLADLILQTIKTATKPEQVGPNTWSSCILCHQLAEATFKDGSKVVKTVPSDSSFLFQTFLDTSTLPAGCP